MGMETEKLDPHDIRNHDLNIYFKYNRLDTSDLVNILDNLNKLYEHILSISSPIYVKEDIAFRNFMEMDSIHTGASITFKLKEGWKPEFNTENGDFNIHIPKKIGVPAIIFLLLMNGMKSSMGLYQDYQNIHLNELEQSIKELELEDKLNESLKRKGKRKLSNHIHKTLESLINNPEISYIEINGYSLPLPRY